VVCISRFNLLNLTKTSDKTYRDTTEEGVQFVSNIDLDAYEKPDITYDFLRNLKGNHFADSAVKQVSNLLFNERYRVEVLNPDNEIDKKYTEILSKMCRKVNLWDAIKVSFDDKNYYGASLFNPVWKWEGSIYLMQKLNHLPSDSFGPAPDSAEFDVHGSILNGIVFDKNSKKIRYFQSYETDVVELTNVFMITDPNSPDIAGVPKLLPIVPLISQINFCVKAQMQKVHRIGAPIIFIKIRHFDDAGNNISKPTDLAYAKKILANWGKDVQYPLKENMEIIIPNFTDSETALDTINLLVKLIMESNSPTRLMNKGGEKALISGDSMAQISLIQNWLRGEKNSLESDFEKLLQPFLDANNLIDYSIRLTIPDFEIDKSELNLKQAETGFKTRSLRINEIRKLLGQRELSDEELAVLKDEYVSLATEIGISNLLSNKVNKSDYNSQNDLKKQAIYATDRLSASIYDILVGLDNEPE